MKKCNSCGTFNKEDDIFCKYCGNELNLFAQSCPRCKNPLEPLAKFCKKCGYDISKPNKQQINPPNKPDKKIFIAIAAVSSVILISIIILFVFIYKPIVKPPTVPTTIVDTSDTSASETTTSAAEESDTSPGTTEITKTEESPETTGTSGSETTPAQEETTQDYEYILGDYRGFQIREDGDKFLKRINIFENGDFIRVECYSEKNDAPILEDYPIGVVDIPKNDIKVSNKRIALYFDYEVDFRPEENKIGYFDMRLKFYLNEPGILEGVTYYDAKFINQKTVSHTYTFELERY